MAKKKKKALPSTTVTGGTTGIKGDAARRAALTKNYATTGIKGDAARRQALGRRTSKRRGRK